MRRREELPEAFIPASPEATASAMAGGQAYMADVAQRLAPYFARAESRHRAMAQLRGLRSEAERKNSWQVAEVCGEPTPYGFRYVLRRADGDAEAVCEELRRYVIQPLGEPNGVLVLDETGFLNKGDPSAGVARPYSGTAGTVENGQIGVFLGDAGRLGQTVLDRERSLPKAWTDKPARCRQAGVPADCCFATKPQLGRQRLARACTAGAPATWVTADRVYGDDRRLRVWLEGRLQAQVLAISGKDYLWLGWPPPQVNTLLARLPTEGWIRLSAGDGTTGPRWDDWCWRPLTAPREPGQQRWLLVRRGVDDPDDLHAQAVFAPQEPPLEAVVRVAGTRWVIEPLFDAAKGEVGLDHDEVRSWTGWYRHRTRAMWALALLTIMRAGMSAVALLKKKLPPPPIAPSLAVFKARRGLLSR